MILVLKKDITAEEIEQLLHRLTNMGFVAHSYQRQQETIIAVTAGENKLTQPELFTALPQVARVEKFSHSHKLASHELHLERKVIPFKHTSIGGNQLTIMAGPCSIESEEQIHQIAAAISKLGVNFLRGGAFKPRTSPYDFQGLGETGLKYLAAAAKKNGLGAISEIMDVSQIDAALDTLDIIQVGARNMYNYTLLKALGQSNKPILLKRGLSATYKEFLMAAEYILNAGNPNVILCERGIRTFENQTRNTLDLNAVPLLKSLSHLPIIVDPSHGTGLRFMVEPMAQAAVAAGADGLIIETHYDPDKSYSDAQQTISIETLANMTPKLQKIYSVI